MALSPVCLPFLVPLSFAVLPRLFIPCCLPSSQCNISFPQPNYRYILTATAIDHTGQEYINMFNDQAVTLLDGHTASEMARIKDEGPAGQGAWSSVFQRANFRQYLFRLKAKVRPPRLCVHSQFFVFVCL